MKFLTIILICSLSIIKISYSQNNFTVKWESPVMYSVGWLPSLESSNSVKELITFDRHTYNIYDGATYQLKYTYVTNDSSGYYFEHHINENYFFDVNNDGMADIVSLKTTSSPDNVTFKVINGANGQVLWQNSYSGFYGLPQITDIDNDGFLELVLFLYNSSNQEKLIILSTPAHAIGISDNSTHATDFKLGQNYPNPFNPSTTIEYSVSKTADVDIKLYNTLGQEVKTLVNETKSMGSYKIELDASNLPSGAYFYQIIIDGNADAKKMVLVK